MNAASSCLVALRDVGHAYEAGNTSVFRVDLEVRPGDLLLLLGANGSGKTTLLKLLGGILLPAHGQVLWEGTDMEEVDEARIEAHVRLVAAEGDQKLIGPTVEDELARVCRLGGLMGPAIPQRVAEALDLVGLADARTWYLDELSAGERRRVTLAAGIIARPQLFLLDEPLEPLDAPSRKLVVEICRQIARAGVSVVVTARELEPWIESVHRVVLLDRGEVLAVGAPSEIVQRETDLDAAGVALPGPALASRELRRAGLPVPRVPTTWSDLAQLLTTRRP